MNNSRILLALDTEIEVATKLLQLLENHVAGVKMHDLIDRYGNELLAKNKWGIRFADVKLNDISKTVERRIRVYQDRADIITIHAALPERTLKIAAQTAAQCNIACIAVTVLTDISNNECLSIFGTSTKTRVIEFAKMAQSAGLAGIVCSPQETTDVRNVWPEALIINPGIRSANAQTHDQTRTATPTEAIMNGADLLVCGREITQADNPLSIVTTINQEIESALRKR